MRVALALAVVGGTLALLCWIVIADELRKSARRDLLEDAHPLPHVAYAPLWAAMPWAARIALRRPRLVAWAALFLLAALVGSGPDEDHR